MFGLFNFARIFCRHYQDYPQSDDSTARFQNNSCGDESRGSNSQLHQVHQVQAHKW
jgi:hypothetical protein